MTHIPNYSYCRTTSKELKHTVQDKDATPPVHPDARFGNWTAFIPFQNTFSIRTRGKHNCQQLLDTPCKAGARSTLYVLDRTFFLSMNSNIRDRRAAHVAWRQVWVCRPIVPYPGEIWVLSQGSFFLKVLKKCPKTGPKEGSKRVPERAAVKA